MPCDLKQIERKVGAAVRELDRELVALRAASQAVRESEGPRSLAQGSRSHYDAESLSHSCIRDSSSATRQVAAAAENNVMDCQKRLLNHQTTLQKHLGDWKRDLDTLERGRVQGGVASAHLREARGGAHGSAQAIKKLLDAVTAALGRAQRVMASASGRRDSSVTSQRRGLQSNAPRDLGAALVTLETAPLLDMCRCGRVDQFGWGARPTPRLGYARDDREVSLLDKVLAGFGLFPEHATCEFAVEMPSFYQGWFRNGRVPADGAERMGDK